MAYFRGLKYTSYNTGVFWKSAILIADLDQKKRRISNGGFGNFDTPYCVFLFIMAFWPLCLYLQLSSVFILQYPLLLYMTWGIFVRGIQWCYFFYQISTLK